MKRSKSENSQDEKDAKKLALDELSSETQDHEDRGDSELEDQAFDFDQGPENQAAGDLPQLTSRNLARHNYSHLSLPDFVTQLEKDARGKIKIDYEDIGEVFMENLMRGPIDQEAIKNILLRLNQVIDDKESAARELFAEIAAAVINGFLLSESNGETYLDFLFKDHPDFLHFIKDIDEAAQERINDYLHSKADGDDMKPLENYHVRECNFMGELFDVHDFWENQGMDFDEADDHLNKLVEEFNEKFDEGSQSSHGGTETSGFKAVQLDKSAKSSHHGPSK